MPSSALARPLVASSVASLYPRHPLHGTGAPRCYPACILSPLAHPSPESFLAPHTRPVLCPLLQRTRTPHPTQASLPAGAGPGAGRARAPAMLITLCYLYLWVRWGRRPTALVLSTVRRLRASRCSFTFCHAAAQPGGARVCLSRGGRVFCVGESQVGGGRGRRVDGARRRHCSSARTAHACTGAWEALLCSVGRGPAAPPLCLRSCSCSRHIQDIPRGT